MADIAVETFDVNPTTTGTTHTLTNDVGSTASAFVKINSSSNKGSSGPTGSTGNTAPNVGGVGVHLTATDTLTFYRNGSSTATKVMGEVWRYTGSASGANEFINRGSYTITISAGNTSASTAVSGITNEDDCVPFLTGWTMDSSDVTEWEKCTVAVYMDGSGNVTAERGSGASLEVVVYVNVVEFTGSNWSVGHGISSSHDSATETVTLNTDSTGTGGSTFDVSDWETAFIEASMAGDTGETGLADILALVYPHADTDKVYFSVTDADLGARNDGNGRIHVVKHPNMVVKRANDTNLAEGNGTYGTATWPTGASTSRNADELALEWFSSSSGTGTAHMRGQLGALITNPTGTIEHWVHRSGNTVHARYGVIDLSGVTTAGTTGQIKAKISSTMTAKPVKVKISGTFTTKPVKHKVSGTFETTNY